MTSPATHRSSRTILASPRAIFRTLLDPETIPAWRAPRGTSIRIEQFEPRTGGTYRIVLTYPQAGDVPNQSHASVDTINGQFAEILPDERIVEIVQIETGDPRYNGVMRLTTMLEPLKDGTKVTLIAEDVPPDASENDHRAGMEMTLRNLANFVE